MILLHFIQISNLFLHQSYLKSPLSVKSQLDKKCKKSFFIIEEIQKYRKCPALFTTGVTNIPRDYHVRVAARWERAALPVELDKDAALPVAEEKSIDSDAFTFMWLTH